MKLATTERLAPFSSKNAAAARSREVVVENNKLPVSSYMPNASMVASKVLISICFSFINSTRTVVTAPTECKQEKLPLRSPST